MSHVTPLISSVPVNVASSGKAQKSLNWHLRGPMAMVVLVQSCSWASAYQPGYLRGEAS